MKSRGLRTFGLLVAVVALTAWSGLTLAFVQKQATTAVAQKEFFKPDLHISTDNVRLAEVQSAVPNKNAWDRFFAENPGEFEVYLDPRSGTPSSVIGHIPIIPGTGVDNHVTLESLSHALAAPVPQVDSALVGRLIRDLAINNADALAIDPDQLDSPRADHITGDNWQINIRQLVDGIPVRYGRFLATINSGNVVLMGTETWGNVRISTKPTIVVEDAVRLGFNQVGGQQATDKMWMKPQLEIIPFAPESMQSGEAYSGPIGQGYGHRLAWTFGFWRDGDSGSYQVSVDAHTGEVLEVQDQNQYASKKITGGIYPLSNTGICPDNQRCGTMQTGSPMPFANTGFAGPNDFTNSAGVYNYLSGTLTTTLNGKYVKVVDTCGAISESSATGDLDMGGTNGDHDCVHPGGTSVGDTASSRTSFFELNKLIEQARGWLPANAWLQAQLTSNVNINLTCNAFYSPSTGQVNFYRSGGGCGNTGEIAAVFDHEWGHGIDDNDTTGTLSNSSETYADLAAVLRLQASCVGYGFFVSDQGCGQTSDLTGWNGDNAQTGGTACELDCSGVRGGDWASHAGGVPDTPANFGCTKCLSGGGPCGREVHCDAMIATEAGWDFAARDLQAAPFSMDSTTAFMTANKVFYQGSGNIGNWQTCTCPSTSNGCGAANGYLQWLAADDDNGNVSDGTPHMTALFAAFNRHNIACTTPTPVNSGCGGGPSVAPVLNVAAGSNQIMLSWSAVAGATSYYVLRSEGFAGCDFGKANIATVVGTSYTDNGVSNGRDYFYSIVAVGSSSACFSPASACIRGTPQPCAGAVSLNKTVYNCNNDTVGITLVDSDLIGGVTHNVTIRSTTESTPETVILTETPANSGVFVGSFLTTGAAPSPGDGKISVVHGDTIIVKYTDVDYCGTPNVDVEATGPVDCQGPIITNTHHQNVTGSGAQVLWDTNEPANSLVTYDTTTPPLASTASKATFDLTRSVQLGGLNQCTQYYYKVSSTDPAGNSATDTNGGTYYSFLTGVNVEPTYPATDLPLVINDNATATSTLVVTDNKPILKATVKISEIRHSYDGDLEIHLVGPDNTDIILADNRGAGGDNFINTVFDDAAGTTIAAGTPPYTGSFKPDQALSAFINKNALGNWKLQVKDTANLDTGTLIAWSLTLTFAPQACGPSVTYTSSTKTDTCEGTGGGSGNGIIEPGEAVGLTIISKNNGTSPVTGVMGTLTTSTPGVTIVDGTATYPDLAPDASAPGNDGYSFAVDPSFPCGTNINFQINYTANEGAWSSNFSYSTGTPGNATTTYTSIDIPKVLADNTTIQSNSPTISDTSTVTAIKVTVGNINHTYDGDLNIRLISPTAVVVPLASRRGAGGDNFISTVFDDAAATPIANGAAPFTGSFKPETPLAPAAGIPAAGIWKLEVNDAANIDTGTLNAWSITLTTVAAPSCVSCAPAYAGEALNLLWTSGGKQTLQWSAAPNASSYHLYKGTPAQLPALLNPSADSCLGATTVSTSTGAIVTSVPAPGSMYWYLVRGANGNGEGPAGNATAGPRNQSSTGSCPP